MKSRTVTILFAPALAAISCAGIFASISVGQDPARFPCASLTYSIACDAMLWLPIVFAAYWIGKREIMLGTLSVFAIAMSIAMGVTYCIYFTCGAFSF